MDMPSKDVKEDLKIDKEGNKEDKKIEHIIDEDDDDGCE